MTFETAEISTAAGKPARCFRFAHGAQIWRHTSGDRPITITDGTFTPEAIQAASVRRSREWDSGGMNITVDRGHPVALLFQQTRPREPVGVTVYEVQRGQTDAYPVRFAGEVAEASDEDHSTILRCTPASYRLKRRIPYLRYSSTCPLALYGSACGIDKELFKDTVLLAAVTGAVLQSAEFAARPDGWFTNGYVQTSQGETRFIVDHVGDLVTLEYPLPVVAGATVECFAGCDRTEATCSSKFSNLVNHRGFAHIPTRDLFGEAVE